MLDYYLLFNDTVNYKEALPSYYLYLSLFQENATEVECPFSVREGAGIIR